MNRFLATGLFGLLTASPLGAQTLIELHEHSEACSFAPDERVAPSFYSFSSSQEARDVVADILSTVGLVPRFRVMAADVPNAAAVIQGEERLIVYSENWIQNEIRDNKWGAVALLAHEIAHHLNGHTLEHGGSRPPTELEADKFAGFAVGKLGGSLQDAQWLFNQLPAKGSASHPPRSARLEAVAVGWRDATEGSAPTQARTTTTAAVRPSADASGWMVIIGSYPHGSLADAERRQSDLGSLGIDARVIDTDDYGNLRDGLFAVVVPAGSKQAALAAREEVARYVPDAYVKKGN